jgi:DNA-binding transcriptional LysR family regulator
MFAETFAVIARRDHPALESRLDPERYAALDHLLVAFRKGSGEGVVDRALAARGLRRRISLRVPSFLSAPLVVSRSDLICTMPRTIALRARQLFGVKVVAPPIELPAIDVAAFWPAQLDSDPAHAWFRDQLFSGRMLPDSLRRRLRRPRR